MKKKVILCFAALFLSAQLAFSQWTQMGTDLDGEAAGDHAGYSTSLSTDGNRLAVGAYGSGGSFGQVRVYEWQGGSWVQLGAGIIGEAGSDFSGVSVSMNIDGSRIAIGATGNDGNGLDSGHVRVYEWQGGSWVQLGADINGEAAGDNSGRSVSISDDGNRVAIGGYLNDDSGADAGQVRVYEWQGGSWMQMGADINGEAAGDWFGISTELSGDGNRLVVGAMGNDGNGTDSGHARVYEWQGGNWMQLGADIDGEAGSDFSGVSVSLNANGSMVVVGADGNDQPNGSGHAVIYEWQGGNWIQRGMELNGASGADAAGRSVSLSADGNRVAVGAPGAHVIFSTADVGRVVVYEWQGNDWAALDSGIYGEAEDDGSGVSISLSGDGSRIAIGSDLNDGNGIEAGHVRAYRFAPPNAIVGLGSGSNSTGEGNLFAGYHSGFNTTTGNNNTFVGESTGFNNVTGSGNVFLGNRAGYNETGSDLLYVANSDTDTPLIWGDFANLLLRFNANVRIDNIPQDDALTRVLVTDTEGNISWRSDATLGGGGPGTFPSYPESAGDGGGNTNSYFGHQSGMITTGADNTFVGYQSGLNNTTGYENSSLGSRTLENNTTGARNTANGVFTLFANVSGNENTAVGYAALGFNETGSRNTASGYNSLLVNTAGTENTATGYSAMNSNQDGSFNTGVGGYVLQGNIGGNSNTALGHGALQHNESGSENVAVGRNSGPESGLTGLSNTTAIGYEATTTASNQVRVGNDQVTDIGGYANWSNLSDGRFKKNIKEDVPGLSFITQLRPVSYELDRSKLRAFLGKEQAAAVTSSEKSIGFIAQEIAEVIEEKGYMFTGIKIPENEKDHYSIRYAEFVMPLVKGMQEQQQLIETLQQEIENLKKMVYGTDSGIGMDTQTKNDALDIKGFALYQNTPNPFDKTTRISAVVPEYVQQAMIVIYNLQGLELERYAIRNRGDVAVEISGGSLPSGMYLYALLADDEVIDVKKMILTK